MTEKTTHQMSLISVLAKMIGYRTVLARYKNQEPLVVDFNNYMKVKGSSK